MPTEAIRGRTTIKCLALNLAIPYFDVIIRTLTTKIPRHVKVVIKKYALSNLIGSSVFPTKIELKKLATA
jgi:hypothetical protein